MKKRRLQTFLSGLQALLSNKKNALPGTDLCGIR